MENLVGYAKTDLMVPLTALREDPDTPLELEVANTAAVTWCEEVNNSRHSETCAVPAQRLAEVELALLAGLPSLRPSLGRREVRKVDTLSCVRFGSARYSVPNRCIGHSVAVLAVGATITIADQGTGEVLAEHPLVAPGDASVPDVHYGGKPRPNTPVRKARPRTEAEVAFCAIGPEAEAFLKGAAAAGNTRLGAELAELSALGAAHGQEVLVAALARAVEFRRWHAADVRSILAAGTGLPQPRAAGDPLDVDLPATASRSLDAYALPGPATPERGELA